jgi:hypothetical protein
LQSFVPSIEIFLDVAHFRTVLLKILTQVFLKNVAHFFGFDHRSIIKFEIEEKSEKSVPGLFPPIICYVTLSLNWPPRLGVAQNGIKKWCEIVLSALKSALTFRTCRLS